MANTVSTQLSKYRNSEFDPGGSFILRGVWYMVNSLFFVSRWLPFSGPKRLLLRLFGAKIGQGVVIKPSVNIKYPWNLEVGNHAWIGEGVWIDNLAQVTIGNDACISQGALILTGNHNYSKSTFDLITKTVVLESGVWIGAKAIVCPGVTCFSHSVLTVGSVANANLDKDAIYSGNPAIKLKERIIH